jgi:hypothetical protein
MTDVEKILLQQWWQGEIRELTRKVMAQEEKRQEKAKKKAATMLGSFDIERREDIDDLYGYGVITESKRNKLIDILEKGQQPDEFYRRKIDFLQDVYTESVQLVVELEKQ